MSHPTRRTVLAAGALAVAIAGSRPAAEAETGAAAGLTLVDRRQPKGTILWWGDDVTRFAA